MEADQRSLYDAAVVEQNLKKRLAATLGTDTEGYDLLEFVGGDFANYESEKRVDLYTNTEHDFAHSNEAPPVLTSFLEKANENGPAISDELLKLISANPRCSQALFRAGREGARPCVSLVFMDSLDVSILSSLLNEFPPKAEREDRRGLKIRDIGFDWNDAYQRLVEHPFEKPVDREPVLQTAAELLSDFICYAERVAKVIVYELNLKEGQTRSVPPLQNALGVAGGMKYRFGNIFFKFANDFRGLYGCDYFAGKAAKNEVLHTNALLEARTSSLHSTITALFTIFGHLIYATAIAPINRSSLVYGSDDGGQTIRDADEATRTLMEQLGTHFSLVPHRVKDCIMHTAGDIEVHVSPRDGRLYVLDLARMLPPVPPNRQARCQSGHLFELFRPEFMTTLGARGLRLNSDAFSAWGEEDSERHALAARKAFVILMDEHVPAVASKLNELCAGFLCTFPLGPGELVELAAGRIPPSLKQTWETELLLRTTKRASEYLHQRGVNVRYMGQVLEHMREKAENLPLLAQPARLAVIWDMVRRVVKIRFHKLCREMDRLFLRFGQGSVQRYLLVAWKLLRLLFLSTADADWFWSTVLAEEVKLKFSVQLQLEEVKQLRALLAVRSVENEEGVKKDGIASLLLRATLSAFGLLPASNVTRRLWRTLDLAGLTTEELANSPNPKSIDHTWILIPKAGGVRLPTVQEVDQSIQRHVKELRTKTTVLGWSHLGLLPTLLATLQCLERNVGGRLPDTGEEVGEPVEADVAVIDALAHPEGKEASLGMRVIRWILAIQRLHDPALRKLEELKKNPADLSAEQRAELEPITRFAQFQRWRVLLRLSNFALAVGRTTAALALGTEAAEETNSRFSTLSWPHALALHCIARAQASGDEDAAAASLEAAVDIHRRIWLEEGEHKAEPAVHEDATKRVQFTKRQVEHISAQVNWAGGKHRRKKKGKKVRAKMQRSKLVAVKLHTVDSDQPSLPPQSALEFARVLNELAALERGRGHGERAIELHTNAWTLLPSKNPVIAAHRLFTLRALGLTQEQFHRPLDAIASFNLCERQASTPLDKTQAEVDRARCLRTSVSVPEAAAAWKEAAAKPVKPQGVAGEEKLDADQRLAAAQTACLKALVWCGDQPTQERAAALQELARVCLVTGDNNKAATMLQDALAVLAALGHNEGDAGVSACRSLLAVAEGANNETKANIVVQQDDVPPAPPLPEVGNFVRGAFLPDLGSEESRSWKKPQVNVESKGKNEEVFSKYAFESTLAYHEAPPRSKKSAGIELEFYGETEDMFYERGSDEKKKKATSKCCTLL